MPDISIFNKFNFEIKPVGIKFLLTRPEGVKRLPGQFALCEMFKEAQQAKKPFYTDFENHSCGGGAVCLGKRVVSGVSGVSGAVASGRLGPKIGIFKNPVANRRTLLSLPELKQGTADYVVFAPLDRLSFDPDILLITARPRQAEIILRANSLNTGAMWESVATGISGCAWLIIYPYLTGKLNYLNTGFTFGMIARELWPEGFVLMGIPCDLLPMLTQNLQDMEWVLPAYKVGREKWIAMFKEKQTELRQETGESDQKRKTKA